MALSFDTQTTPLAADANGVVRVGNTRVTLDTVISAFSDGATAEEIVQQYPSLSLADVYQVIAYYLRRPSEVEAYLQERRAKGTAVQKQNEARSNPESVRSRLLARRTRRDR